MRRCLSLPSHFVMTFCVLFSLTGVADEMLQQRIEAWQMGFEPFVQAEPIRNSLVLMEFYQGNQFEPIWLESGKPNTQALAGLITLLK